MFSTFDEVRHSTAARTAMAYVLLFSLTTAVSYLVVYALAQHEARERLTESVEADVDFIESELREPQLDAIDDLAGSTGPEKLRMLFDQKGALIGGNAQPMMHFEGWQVVDANQLHFTDGLERESDQYLLLGSTRGNHRILAGEGMRLAEEVTEILLSAFVWGWTIALAAGVTGAWFLAKRARGRLTKVESSLQTFAQGNLQERLPVLGVGDDIDRVSAAVNAALSRVEELVHTVKQISSDIAHDLKSPMTRLRQTLETADMAKDAPHAALGEAILQADAITETFEALLRIAQIEAGARRARFQLIDLAEVLDAVTDAFRPAAEEVGQCLILSASEHEAVEGDHELLIQLFANLVENAIKHGQAHNEIRVSLRNRNGQAVVSVADRGPGIPEQEMERVLRRFYRLDRSRSTQGTGLGLALVKAVADLHGANLTLVNNEPGLRCELIFPAAYAKPTAVFATTA